VIGEMDLPSAKELIFDGAVYLHLGDQFIVQKLDLENQRCYVEATDVNYWTDSIVKTDIKVLAIDEERRTAGVRVAVGDILVRSQATKFKKLKFHTNENVGYGDINLPPDEMHTRACALVLDPGTGPGRRYEALPEAERAALMVGLGALLSTVAPVFLLCDPRDLGVSERTRDPHFDRPCLIFFDRYPGGIGLSEGFARDLDRILAGAADLVRRCSCTAGCPSCVGAPGERAPFDAKDLAARFLGAWIADAGPGGAGAEAGADA